jgi:hypothetical protein
MSFNMIGPCPHFCENKTAFGYCMTTGCINPMYNQSHSVYLMTKEEYDRMMMEKDADYGRGNNS